MSGLTVGACAALNGTYPFLSFGSGGSPPCTWTYKQSISLNVVTITRNVDGTFRMQIIINAGPTVVYDSGNVGTDLLCSAGKLTGTASATSVGGCAATPGLFTAT